MPVFNGIITLDEFKNWVDLGDTFDDLDVESVITAVSREIEQFCQRTFRQVTETRVFDADNDTTVKLGPFNDLRSVTSLATDDNGDGVYETTWAASDYQLLPLQPTAAPETKPYRRIRSTGSRFFPQTSCVGRVGLVQVTGNWGWDTIPEAVRQACKIQTHRIFKRRETPQGVAGFGDFGVVRITRQRDPDVADLLEPYRHTAVLVA